ncbi:MAG: hypothetical protein AAFW74_00335, partial [Pseudomonadota bacterium]
MSWSADKTTVNSWNEWDPLKHVIVGLATDCHIPPAEPALDAKVPEESDMRGQWGKRPQETIDRGNELLDGFARRLLRRQPLVTAARVQRQAEDLVLHPIRVDHRAIGLGYA